MGRLDPQQEERLEGSLGTEERKLVEALESNHTAALESFKDVKRRKRILADRFKEYRRA